MRSVGVVLRVWNINIIDRRCLHYPSYLDFVVVDVVNGREYSLSTNSTTILNMFMNGTVLGAEQ